MSQPVPLKVYANLIPVTDEVVRDVQEAAASAIPQEEDAQTVFHEDDLLRISFEGIYFPTEDVVGAIKKHLVPGMTGKLDVLDMDDWKLTRFFFDNGFIQERSQSLNSVMDYNGF